MFNIKHKDAIDVVLVPLLLTLNNNFYSNISIVKSEHIIAGWEKIEIFCIRNISYEEKKVSRICRMPS